MIPKLGLPPRPSRTHSANDSQLCVEEEKSKNITSANSSAVTKGANLSAKNSFNVGDESPQPNNQRFSQRDASIDKFLLGDQKGSELASEEVKREAMMSGGILRGLSDKVATSFRETANPLQVCTVQAKLEA